MSDAVLYIAHFSAGSVSIPIIIYLKYRKTLDSNLVLLGYLVVISLLADLVSLTLFRSSLNSILIINIFLIIQFLFIYLLFVPYLSLPKEFGHWAMSILLVTFLINLLFYQGPWIFNSFSNTSICMVLILVSLRFFYVLLRDLPESNIINYPFFLIAVAVLVYYSGNLFLFIINNYLTIGIDGTHPLMWILHNVLNISKNAFFAIALWKGRRSKI